MSPLGTNYYSHQVPVGGGEGLLQYYRALEVGGGGKKENQQGLGRPCAMRVWRIKLRNGPL